jgi:ABC-type Zn2+ transport system substrate-binding protein/surface adhesin
MALSSISETDTLANSGMAFDRGAQSSFTEAIIKEGLSDNDCSIALITLKVTSSNFMQNIIDNNKKSKQHYGINDFFLQSSEDLYLFEDQYLSVLVFGDILKPSVKDGILEDAKTLSKKSHEHSVHDVHKRSDTKIQTEGYAVVACKELENNKPEKIQIEHKECELFLEKFKANKEKFIDNEVEFNEYLNSLKEINEILKSLMKQFYSHSSVQEAADWFLKAADVTELKKDISLFLSDDDLINKLSIIESRLHKRKDEFQKQPSHEKNASYIEDISFEVQKVKKLANLKVVIEGLIFLFKEENSTNTHNFFEEKLDIEKQLLLIDRELESTERQNALALARIKIAREQVLTGNKETLELANRIVSIRNIKEALIKKRSEIYNKIEEIKKQCFVIIDEMENYLDLYEEVKLFDAHMLSKMMSYNDSEIDEMETKLELIRALCVEESPTISPELLTQIEENVAIKILNESVIEKKKMLRNILTNVWFFMVEKNDELQSKYERFVEENSPFYTDFAKVIAMFKILHAYCEHGNYLDLRSAIEHIESSFVELSNCFSSIKTKNTLFFLNNNKKIKHFIQIYENCINETLLHIKYSNKNIASEHKPYKCIELLSDYFTEYSTYFLALREETIENYLKQINVLKDLVDGILKIFPYIQNDENENFSLTNSSIDYKYLSKLFGSLQNLKSYIELINSTEKTNILYKKLNFEIWWEDEINNFLDGHIKIFTSYLEYSKTLERNSKYKEVLKEFRFDKNSLDKFADMGCVINCKTWQVRKHYYLQALKIISPKNIDNFSSKAAEINDSSVKSMIPFETLLRQYCKIIPIGFLNQTNPMDPLTLATSFEEAIFDPNN